MVIFSHRYLHIKMINVKTFCIPGCFCMDPSEHHYTTHTSKFKITFENLASTIMTMSNNMFNHSNRQNTLYHACPYDYVQLWLSFLFISQKLKYSCVFKTANGNYANTCQLLMFAFYKDLMNVSQNAHSGELWVSMILLPCSRCKLKFQIPWFISSQKKINH